MTKEDLKKIKNIHFIGVGGAGMSAVARMMISEGKKVSGSDKIQTKITYELEKLGAKISIGENKENLPDDSDLVIYTVAVPKDNLELSKAKELKIPVITYPEALSVISADKFTIAISGTHGKTTTTAMAAKILVEAGLDPTVIVGGIMKDSFAKNSGNFIAGKSKPARLNGRSVGYLVVEADEYRKSFLNLNPKILLINSLDADHLDFYKNLEDIQNAFRELALKVPEDGTVLYDKNNQNVLPVVKNLKCNIREIHDFQGEISLKIPGRHNRENARAAFAIACILGIPKEKSLKSLSDFVGTERRFEFKGETSSGALVYDEYAHNPQKVRAALQGARELYPDKKIIVVFQPHLYSRTKTQLKEFGRSFGEADLVLLLPIYAAREGNDPTISSEILAKEIKKSSKEVLIFESEKSVEKYLHENSKNGNVVLTIGAGDITNLSNNLIIK